MSLSKPTSLALVCDDLDKPFENLVNEACMRLSFEASADFLALMDEVDFTRRGAYTWSIGLRNNGRKISRFFKKYAENFIPQSMISIMNDSQHDNLHGHNEAFSRNGNQLLHSAFTRGLSLRNALEAQPDFVFPRIATDPDFIDDMNAYYNIGGQRANYQEMNAIRQRVQPLYSTFGGVSLEVKTEVLWVRVFPNRTFANDYAPYVHFNAVKNVRRTVEVPSLPRNIAPIVTQLRQMFGEDSVKATDQRVNELLAITEDSVCVGYAPNRPASVVFYRGKNVEASIGTGLRSYKKGSETEISLEKALKIQKRNSKVNFLVHPSLTDMVNMTNAVPYEGDERLKDYQKDAVGLHLSTDIGYLQTSSTGLGKTVIQLCAMREKARSIENYRGLIVCEANVRNQWAEEAKKWFPEAHVAVISSGRDKDKVLGALSHEGPSVVITSYAHTLLSFEERERRSEREAYLATLTFAQKLEVFAQESTPELTIGSMILDERWNDICADEAVAIRNGSSKQASILWDLRLNSQVAVAMTATPINKNPDDIGRLIAWVRKDKNMFYGAPLSEQYDTESEKGAKALFDAFGPLLFRRDTSVLQGELPDVKTHTMMLTPSPAEKALADSAERELKRCYMELLTAMDELEGTEGSDKDQIAAAREALKAANGAWLGGSQLARMATSDPSALLGSSSVGAALLAGQGLIEQAMTEEPTKRKYFIGKALAHVAKGEQIIVFTEFATVANSLVKALQENGINAKPYTGKNGAQRDQYRVAFQNGELDVLVCTKAGERGLTLHKASAIYHYDLPWTLEAIIQRTGRGVRIGSENKTVEIHFMVMEGTIEQRVASNLVNLGVAASLILDHARGVDIKKTETATAMGGLIKSAAKGGSKNVKDFGKLLFADELELAS